jgi:WD40 repeat protein
LGYPAEISSPLDADHHGVAKFRSVDDPNYEQVRNVLRLFVDNLESHAPVLSAFDRASLEQLLGVFHDPSLDLEVLEDRMMRDSCRWVLHRETFRQWRGGLRDGCSLLWLRGLPGVGKSVLASFVIRSLQKSFSDTPCCYYFFNSQDEKRRSVKHMLTATAFQVALRSSTFYKRLLGLHGTGSFSVDQLQAINIWESIFQGLLLRQSADHPMFWVIDGLDEADHPEVLIRLLSKLERSHMVRILIISRPIKEAAALRSLRIPSTLDEITFEDTRDDIRAYAYETVGAILPDDAHRDDICNKILEKAHGSFLWVSLAIEQLKDHWHTPDTLGQTLDELPEGMEAFYDRMVQTIAGQPAKPRAMASRILTWAMCSLRPLELAELETVLLSSEFGAFLNLRDSVAQLCANFVIVRKSQVALVHDTARSFLLDRGGGQPLSIDPSSGHQYIAEICLKFLMDQKKDWRRALTSSQQAAFDKHPFLSYAVTWWAYHASHAQPSCELAALVRTFLNKSALVWIHAATLLGDMRILTRSGESLRALANWETQGEPFGQSLREDLMQWSRDLTRVPGRFGNILASKPLAIYDHIVPFCPDGSMIRRHFGHFSSISVSEISDSSWGNCVGRLMMREDDPIVRIVCQGPYVVAQTLGSKLVVAYAESCEEVRRIMNPGGMISAIASSGTSSLLAVANWDGIRVWDLGVGEEVVYIPMPADLPSPAYSSKALALAFTNEDESLLVGFHDLSIRCVKLATGAEEWGHMLKPPEDVPGESYYTNMMSISPDGLWVIAGNEYRGRLYAWSLDLPESPPRDCLLSGYEEAEDYYFRKDILWRPGMASAFIPCRDGKVVEWHLPQDKLEHIPHISGSEVALSFNGTSISAYDDDSRTVTVWDLPGYQVRHELRDVPRFEGSAFGPDGRRLYTNAGDSCDVWELDGATHAAAEEPRLSNPAITSLLFDPSGRFCLTRSLDGALFIHDTTSRQKVTRWRVGSQDTSVSTLLPTAWSPTGRYVASGDPQRGVAVYALRESASLETAGLVVTPLRDIDFGGEKPLQVLFHPSDECILVSCPPPRDPSDSPPSWKDFAATGSVWSLETGNKVCETSSTVWGEGRWLRHPTDDSIVLFIDKSTTIRAFRWDSLAEVNVTGDGAGLEPDPDYSQTQPFHLNRVVPVGERYVVFQATWGSDMAYPVMVTWRRTIAVDLRQPTIHMPSWEVDDMSDLVTHLVGSHQGHLVFLDHDYYFCTWDLGVGAASLKRHFCLPKDWLHPGTLNQCVVNEEGTVLCPKNGEVCVIRGGIKL